LKAEYTVFISKCIFENFQAPGPGGQKRNKKLSAVRLTHCETGISATSCKSRYQLENKKIAFNKLKIYLAIEIRGSGIILTRNNISLSNKDYPLWVGLLFDKLWEYSFSINKTAKSLGLSTSKLIKLISRDSLIWKNINYNRELTGLKKLIYPGKQGKNHNKIVPV